MIQVANNILGKSSIQLRNCIIKVWEKLGAGVSAMSKKFLVASGFLARIEATWYSTLATLIILPNERVELFRRSAAGQPLIRIGSHSYDDLNPSWPPAGLCCFQSTQNAQPPLIVVPLRDE